MKKFLIFILFCCGTVLFLYYYYQDLLQFATQATGPHKACIITVSPGQSFNTTVKLLHKADLVQDVFNFKLLARLKGYDTKIKAGEYRFWQDLPPLDILENLVQGRILLHKLVIPEGYNLVQIAGVVKLRFPLTKNFLQKSIDLEGYLFPDTYQFPINVTSEKIIKTMQARFQEVFIPKWKKQAQTLGLSIHEVVTLASIIEKETGQPQERPLIASVFHNRLTKGMRLESDPTVIYGIKNFNGNLTRKDLRTRTPYNTYTIKGLPPGPIAAPGQAAIEAVLYPADSDYLFFVSKNNGTHQFSKNLSEHRHAVRQFQ